LSLFACQSSKDQTKPPIKIEPIEKINLSKQIMVTPLGEEAKRLNVSVLKHTMSNLPKQSDVPSKYANLQTVQTNTETIVEKIKHRMDGDCWIGSSWEVNYGFGQLEDLLMDWIRTDKKTKVFINPPTEADGIVFELSGCHPKSGWTKKMVAIGERGQLNYKNYVNKYQKKRKENTTPVVIFNFDIDQDGNEELISYNIINPAPNTKKSAAVKGELGIVWGADDQISSGVFQLDQGRIFPNFLVADKNLNGGQYLFFGVLRCCGQTSFKAFNLNTNRIFTNEFKNSKQGTHPVFLLPSKNQPRVLKIGN